LCDFSPVRSRSFIITRYHISPSFLYSTPAILLSSQALYHKIPTIDNIHLYTTPAGGSPFGISVYLKYGFTTLKPGNISFASSFLTLG
jgi:hypothetical protein